MKRTVLVISILAIAIMPLTVMAHSDQETSDVKDRQSELREKKESIEQRRVEKQQELEQRSARRCEFAKNRLQFHAKAVNTTLEYRSTTYQKIIERLNLVALRAENNNLDASELKSAIKGLSNLVANFETDYSLYWAEVNNAANMACAEESTLRSVTSIALSAMRTARADAQDIRDYTGDEVKPALETLRTTIEDSDEAQTEEASSLNETNTQEAQ